MGTSGTTGQPSLFIIVTTFLLLLRGFATDTGLKLYRIQNTGYSTTVDHTKLQGTSLEAVSISLKQSMMVEIVQHEDILGIALCSAITIS